MPLSRYWGRSHRKKMSASDAEAGATVIEALEVQSLTASVKAASSRVNRSSQVTWPLPVVEMLKVRRCLVDWFCRALAMTLRWYLVHCVSVACCESNVSLRRVAAAPRRTLHLVSDPPGRCHRTRPHPTQPDCPSDDDQHYPLPLPSPSRLPESPPGSSPSTTLVCSSSGSAQVLISFPRRHPRCHCSTRA